MKRCRKILLILAAAVFAFALFALTACGGGDEDEGEKVKVTLDKPTLALTLKEDETVTGTIKATVQNSDEAVEWEVTVGNNTVITIAAQDDVCTVTAVAAGSATVKASVGDVSATCAVTVKAAGETGDGDGDKDEDGDKDKDKDEDGDKDEDEDENLPKWEFSRSITHGEAAGFIWHQVFSESITADMPVDVVVKVNGATVTPEETLVQVGTIQVRISGSRFDSVKISFTFKDESGEAIAKASYSYEGAKEIALDSKVLSISKDSTETVSVTSVNGKTDLTDLKISWSIADTEGTGVATIPANSNGASVVVTAVAAGKATLTCTVGEGANAFHTTCAITVVEGDVVITVVDVTTQLIYNNDFKVGDNKDAVQIYFNLQGEDYSELVQQIDPSQTTVAVTMDGNASTSAIHRKDWQEAGNYNLWLQIEVESDWAHDYVFTFSFKNTKGEEVATATYERIAPKTLTLSPTKLNLTLADGETVTGTVSATKTSKVEGDIQWTIDDTNVATITVSEDKLSVTVTAVAKGEATITATVDGLTETCTVNVLEAGELPPAPESTFTINFEEVYGDHYMHFSTTSDLPSDFSFDYVKVYKNDEADGTQRWCEFADGHIRVYVTDAANEFDGDWKFEFYKGGVVVATEYFSYPIA